ncbi:MAG TPA: radical SAM family heme chaperone HemW [Candidatus Polarisedimenticolia bacterium]|nr:radical SAM family heme chaperone HemW [Candidatus Polarisedimenticolia bacterium]
MIAGLYVHVPYCSVRCSYCDFYLVTSGLSDAGRYCRALCAEIGAAGSPDTVVDTIHFGGGTPSILPPADLDGVLAAIRRAFRVAEGAEITLEANPEDLDRSVLERLAGAGFNRIAIGVQSLDDRQLRIMRRAHTAERALAAIAAARSSPIAGVAVDLMLGLPEQDCDEALRGVQRIVDAGVDHVSIYLLEVHARTRLGRAIDLGRTTPMGEDESARLYEAAAESLVAAGFEQYEISNFARPGHRSRHNLKYWTDQDYFGFGPSAHSYVGGRRWWNAADLRAYLRLGGARCERHEEPAGRTARGAEALCAGLRLCAGVALQSLRARYGSAIPAVDDARLVELRDAGLVSIAGDRLCLTPRGRLLSNEVLARLIPSPGGRSTLS